MTQTRIIPEDEGEGESLIDLGIGERNLYRCG